MKDMISVSKMSGKLAGFKAINFSALDNPFCERMSQIEGTVCASCYSRRMLLTFRKRAREGWKQNSILMSDDLEDWQLPRFEPESYVRLLSHGELDNLTQLYNFQKIALLNPETHFTMWTKRVDLIEKADFLEPASNLRIIASSPYIGIKAEVDHSRIDGVFTVYQKGEVPEDSFHCAGKKCATCMHCYTSRLFSHIGEELR